MMMFYFDTIEPFCRYNISRRAGGDAEASFMSAEIMCMSVKMWQSGSAAIG